MDQSWAERVGRNGNSGHLIAWEQLFGASVKRKERNGSGQGCAAVWSKHQDAYVLTGTIQREKDLGLWQP